MGALSPVCMLFALLAASAIISTLVAKMALMSDAAAME
jgi:hypothetical protein